MNIQTLMDYVGERDDALAHAQEMEEKVKEFILEHQMLEFISINWQKLRSAGNAESGGERYVLHL